MTAACRSCRSEWLDRVLSSYDVPVENSRLYDDAASAAAVSRGDLVLERCNSCGFVQNGAFDDALVRYDDDYEDSQSFSPYFREFAERIIDELLDGYGLRGVAALEIGCGQGDFLRTYCEMSGSTGMGIDPLAPSGAEPPGTVDFRAEAFGVGSGHFDAGVVICRHTLEHVADVSGFLSTIRQEFDDRPATVMYLEVPDLGRIAREGAFWDVYYEHCAYFDRDCLVDLLRRTGWEPLVCRLEYQGQYLVAHARPATPTRTVERAGPLPDFSRMTSELEHWRTWAAERSRRDTRLALWAASSKSVGFLANVPTCRPVVAVDINPAKWGRFIPGSAVPVCSPGELCDYDVDAVLIMNPVYLGEIRAQLGAMGLTPELLTLGK